MVLIDAAVVSWSSLLAAWSETVKSTQSVGKVDESTNESFCVASAYNVQLPHIEHRSSIAERERECVLTFPFVEDFNGVNDG